MRDPQSCDIRHMRYLVFLCFCDINSFWGTSIPKPFLILRYWDLYKISLISYYLFSCFQSRFYRVNCIFGTIQTGNNYVSVYRTVTQIISTCFSTSGNFEQLHRRQRLTTDYWFTKKRMSISRRDIHLQSKEKYSWSETFASFMSRSGKLFVGKWGIVTPTSFNLPAADISRRIPRESIVSA